jgi:exonuclease SbcD
MRILHTSDWHLGKRLDTFSRIEEQIAVMDEICQLADAHQADAVVVAGDLFDTINPPIEATQLLYKTLKRLAADGRRAVIAIAGNHDSPERIEAPDPLARECGILFAGYPNSEVLPIQLDEGIKVTRSQPGFIELQLPACDAPLRMLLTPYANETRLRTFLGNDNRENALREVLRLSWQSHADKYCDAQGVNLLMTHLFMIREGAPMPEESDDEKTILYVGGAQPIFTSDVPTAIQYVALGHLHRQQTIDNNPCPVVYSGSPLAYSFSEAEQNKYAMLVDVEPGQPAIVTPLPLTSGMKLMRKRFGAVDDAVEWLTAHQQVYVELTLVSDTYLTAEERKRLNDAHCHIVTLIPEVKNTGIDAEGHTASIDPTQSIESLFIDYFKSRNKGQEPNERLINLLKETTSLPNPS